MKYTKENLEKFIEFIDKVANEPGNESFRNSLISVITKNIRNSNHEAIYSVEKKLIAIETYLAIHYDNIIEYSDFEIHLKDQLLRDCIEMCRYQNGTPNHKIDYGEFCRYAHLQAEEMINYLLLKVTNSNIKYVEEFIKENNSSYNSKNKPTNIHHIYYTQKLLAVKNAFKMLSKTYSFLWFLNDFRNELSHRNSFSDKNDDKALLLYEKSGYNSNSFKINELNSEQKEIYNKGQYVIKKRKEEYMIIYETLENLKQLVLKNREFKYSPIMSKDTIGSTNPILMNIKDQIEKS